MTEDDKLQDSLAAWVPPWQRATPAKPSTNAPASADAASEPDAVASEPPDAADDVTMGTDLTGGATAMADTRAPADPGAVVEEADEAHRERDPGDDDYSDVQQPETDALREPETDPERSDPGDDDYSDVQQPETDEFEGVSPEASILEEIDLDIETDDVTPVDLPDAPAVDGSQSDTAPESGLAEPVETPPTRRPENLRGALEAILLVVDEPVPDGTLADVLDAPAADVIMELETLAAEYAESRRGFELRRVAGGWRLYTRGDYSAYVERFVLDGQSVRLTQAALETLAVIAYQQPVTRSRIAAIRGVNCDGVVRTLVTRGLIEECGTQPESGAFLYRTTQVFLEKLGLDSIDELPPLAPFLPDDVNGLVDAER